MHKTTVYLDADLRRALARLARDEGTSEAEVIRSALRSRVAASARPSPRCVGAGESRDPDLAARDERALHELIARRRTNRGRR